jgi:hypothetical protein
MQRTTIASSFLALALLAAAGADAHSGRVIDIDAGTRYLNVYNGETVTIRQDGHSFTWHVQAPNNLNAVPLSRIAPQQVASHDVLVYIAASSQYQNS